MEFSRPSLPDIPRMPANGRPSALDIGRATTGASMPMPMKTATAPRPTNWMAGFSSPTASAPIPRTAMMLPITIRRRDDSVCSALVVDQRGHRRDAHRTAGRADRRHHRHPDADDEGHHHGAGFEDEWSRRQGDPEPLEQGLEPHCRQDPQAEADQRGDHAEQVASMSTERNTCRRLAPTIRSIASSRVR